MLSAPLSTLVGQRFGRLVCLQEKIAFNPRRRLLFCRCDCGKLKDVDRKNVLGGRVKSCGCLHRPHGGYNTPLHTVWTGIKQRCLNPKTPTYHRYGGRGIKVCKEWRESFVTFRDFCLENGWKRGLQIDRTDNNQGYSPDNVRFVTRSVNIRNSEITPLKLKALQDNAEKARAHNQKPVKCIETGQIWRSAKIASLDRGEYAQAVSQAIMRNNGLRKGFHFAYLTEKERKDYAQPLAHQDEAGDL